MRARLLAALAIAAAAVAVAVVAPDIHTAGDFVETDVLDLGTTSPTPGARTRGGVRQNGNGYVAAPDRRALASVPVDMPAARGGHVLLRVWAYAYPRIPTSVRLRLADGRTRELGRPGHWNGKTFDLTQVPAGRARLEARTVNSTPSRALFLDRVTVERGPDSARSAASPWAVGLMVALVVLALLALARRLERHWPLAALLGGASVLLWHDARALELQPLSGGPETTWHAARAASWLGFHDGLLWGSWERLSSLTVQLFHALTPLVGTASAGVHSAGVFAAVLALAALYALGNRAAGRLGAVAMVMVALATGPFRDAALAGSPVPVIVLAGALFAYGLHACLAEASTQAMLLLGAGSFLVALAAPVLLPGVVAVTAIVALAYAPAGRRLRGLAAGFLAIAVLLIPHAVSTADQNGGDLFADMSAQATYARNVEFAGRGHGAPSPVQFEQHPYGGDPVSLPAYLFGDHSAWQVVGGALHGAQKALFGLSGGGLAGALGFALAALGVLYLLIVPRLRMLALLPLLACAPTLFFVDRGAISEMAGIGAAWPGLLTGVGLLGYALTGLLAPAARRSRGRLAAADARRKVALSAAEGDG